MYKKQSMLKYKKQQTPRNNKELRYGFRRAGIFNNLWVTVTSSEQKRLEIQQTLSTGQQCMKTMNRYSNENKNASRISKVRIEQCLKLYSNI